MQLVIEEDTLKLTFEGMERFWAFKISPVEVPLGWVEKAETSLPPSSWKTLRAPGTFVPGLIKAGTYYTDRGKELWYATRGKREKPLTIELSQGPYKRIALTIEGHDNWAERINAWSRR